MTCPTYTTIGFLSSPWYYKGGYWFSFEWKNTTPNQGLAVVDYVPAGSDPNPLDQTEQARWYDAKLTVRCYRVVHNSSAGLTWGYTAYEPIAEFGHVEPLYPQSHPCEGGPGGIDNAPSGEEGSSSNFSSVMSSTYDPLDPYGAVESCGSTSGSGGTAPPPDGCHDEYAYLDELINGEWVTIWEGYVTVCE